MAKADTEYFREIYNSAYIHACYCKLWHSNNTPYYYREDSINSPYNKSDQING